MRFLQVFLLSVLFLTLEAKLQQRPSSHHRIQPVKQESQRPVTYKYFHEPKGSAHYDARYFAGDLTYEEHRPVLRHLVRSYLTTCDRLGVETWLAHGTLLGWWWNGRVMPWDGDLDVQVSSATLYWLGKYMNRTQHEYTYIDAGLPANNTYVLDVNPHHIQRDRGNGLNVIDARWIDTSNGMYIDITGLAERDPDGAPGVWSCKNSHHHRTMDLFPMRQSEFEGVPATIPYNFQRILAEEYGLKSLATTEFHRRVHGLPLPRCDSLTVMAGTGRNRHRRTGSGYPSRRSGISERRRNMDDCFPACRRENMGCLECRDHR